MSQAHGRDFAVARLAQEMEEKEVVERLATVVGGQGLTVFGRVGLAGLLLALVIAGVPQATGESKALVANTLCNVTFQVKLIPTNPAQPWEESSRVVVWLVAATPGLVRGRRSELPHYRITQRQKKFEPRLLVVPTGSIVEFPNYDPWLHNVFSDSRSKRFDLGLYEAGVRKAVAFNRPGVSYLFCSIHPEMMAIVLTVDSAYFGVSDKMGRISIASVPGGEYVLHVWHENSTPQVLEALQRTIFVGDGNRRLPTISIALADEAPMSGENASSEQSTFAGGN